MCISSRLQELGDKPHITFYSCAIIYVTHIYSLEAKGSEQICSGEAKEKLAARGFAGVRISLNPLIEVESRNYSKFPKGEELLECLLEVNMALMGELKVKKLSVYKV